MSDGNSAPAGCKIIVSFTNLDVYEEEETGRVLMAFDPEERPGGGGGKNPRVATSHGFKDIYTSKGNVRINVNVIA